MNNRLHRYLPHVLGACLLGFTLCGPANADLVGTDEAVAPAQAGGDRERVRAFMARPEVVKQLQAAGVSREEAEARVRAMSDEEVRAIAGKLDALPAGGRLTDFQFVVVILLFAIFLVLLL
ncbi:MAG TPA: PA2779 family protein [Burkholderiales bacterium]|nr:PA2779 family protein [Burkholderiales bacterium]